MKNKVVAVLLSLSMVVSPMTAMAAEQEEIPNVGNEEVTNDESITEEQNSAEEEGNKEPKANNDSSKDGSAVESEENIPALEEQQDITSSENNQETDVQTEANVQLEDVITFEDPVLQEELLDTYDYDKNGYLTKDELTIRNLFIHCEYNGKQVQTLNGIEKLEKTHVLYLYDCFGVKDFTATNDMPNLEGLNISDAKMDNLEWLKPRKKLSTLGFSDCEIKSLKGLEKMTELYDLELSNVGFMSGESLRGMDGLNTLTISNEENFSDIQSLAILKNLNCLSISETGVSDEDKWKFEAIPDEVNLQQGDTFSILKYLWLIDIKTNILEGEDCISLDDLGRNVTALKSGNAKIHVTYTDELSKDVIIHINQGEDQTPGEKYEGNVEIKQPKVSYDIDGDEKPSGYILEDNGNLWSTTPEIKKVQTGVKQYIADYAYITSKEGKASYKQFGYYLDKNNVLWTEDHQKIAEDITDLETGGAFDAKGNFYDLHMENPEPISDVVKWKAGEDFNVILKSDGSVWERKTSKGEKDYSKLMDNVKDITKWGTHTIACLKTDGTIFEKDYYNNYSKTYNVEAITLGAYGKSFYDENGYFYLVADDDVWVQDKLCVGKIKVVDKVSVGGKCYILSEDGNLYFEEELGKEPVQIDSEVAELNHEFERDDENSWLYRKENGKYWGRSEDLSRKELTTVMLKRLGNFKFYNNYNGKSGALVRYDTVFLDNVIKIWFYDGEVYAFRTDGSIWKCSNSITKVGTINEKKAPDEVPEKVSWNLKDGVLTISGKGVMDSYDKASKQPWYKEKDKITSVVIEDGITEIGNFDFYGLTSLKNISIADSVKKIGDYAFKNCTALTDIQLPKKLTSIGESAFYGCSGLKEVTFPETLKKINAYAFARCNGIQKITFEGDAPAIQDNAFLNVKAAVDYPKENTTWTDDKKQNYGGKLRWDQSEPWELKDHILKINDDSIMTDYDSVTKTPWYGNRDDITGVEIADGVTKIGTNAFYGFNNLTSVKIPDSVTSIGGYAFKNCGKLTDVALPKDLKKLGESAFYGCTAISSITIPEGLYTIWAYTFKNCTSLTEVKLPSTLIKIDEAAFYGCTSLSKLEIPDNVAIIGIYAFKNCNSLSNLTLPKKLAQIREASFYGCSSLTEVIVPEKVESIGDYAFRKCEGLKKVTLPDALNKIGESAFYGCKKLDELVVPEGVTKLGNYAFKGCEKIKTVKLPASLENIGESTFYGCNSIESVEIPKNVKKIGNYAFSRCGGLKKVTFKGDAPEIAENAFNKVTADVTYDTENSTWTDEKKQNYGGTLNWNEPKDPGTEEHNFEETSRDLEYIHYTCKDCGETKEEFNDQTYTIDLGDGKSTTVVGHFDLDMRREIFLLVNQKRTTVGVKTINLAPLESTIQDVANIRAYEITNSYSHTRPNGERAITSFYGYADTDGENLAKGFQSAEDVCNAWFSSSTHNQNITNNSYQTIGIGVFCKKKTDGSYVNYFSQMFSTKNNY